MAWQAVGVWGFMLGITAGVLLEAQSSRPADRQVSEVGQVCSVESLARAAAVDTTKLRRVEWQWTPAKSAEGGTTTLYYDGTVPRVVVIVYYGETGQITVRYYLLAGKDEFLVEQEDLEYVTSIVQHAPPVLRSRRPSATYVCGAGILDPLDKDEMEAFRSELSSVLGRRG